MITTLQFKELCAKLDAISDKLDKSIPVELLTSKDVMELLQISRNTYNRLREEGILKVYALKGKLYSKRSEILTAINDGFLE